MNSNCHKTHNQSASSRMQFIYGDESWSHTNLAMYFEPRYFSAKSGHCTKTESANHIRIRPESDIVVTRHTDSTKTILMAEETRSTLELSHAMAQIGTQVPGPLHSTNLGLCVSRMLKLAAEA